MHDYERHIIIQLFAPGLCIGDLIGCLLIRQVTFFSDGGKTTVFFSSGTGEMGYVFWHC